MEPDEAYVLKSIYYGSSNYNENCWISDTLRVRRADDETVYIYDLCNNTMTYSFSGGKIHIKRLRGPARGILKMQRRN